MASADDGKNDVYGSSDENQKDALECESSGNRNPVTEATKTYGNGLNVFSESLESQRETIHIRDV